MKMSKRAYSRHRGCSDTAVRKAVIEGRITADAEGLIDVEEADRVWKRDAGEARGETANLGANQGVSSQEVRTAANAKLVRQVLAEEGQDLDGDENLTLNHVRMAVGILKARDQQFLNEQTAKKLLPEADVSATVIASFARVKARMLSIPSTLAPALLGVTDVKLIKELLTDAVHEALAELAWTVVVDKP